MHRKRFSWVALVGIGLAGVVAVSAAASTLAARSTASPLEIAPASLCHGASRRDVRVGCAVLRVWDRRRCWMGSASA
jgi:hypothetical protein